MRYADKYLEDSPPLNGNNLKELVSTLAACCKVYFGNDPDNIADLVFSVSAEAILERFKGITLLDVQNAFKTREIEKRQGTSITRDELIRPIADYWCEKSIFLNELIQVHQKRIEKEKEPDYALEFEQKARKELDDSLTFRQWTGNPYEALFIAKQYADLATKEEKAMLFAVAKKKKKDMMNELDQVGTKAIKDIAPHIANAFTPTNSIYAVELMNYLLENDRL